LTGAGAFPARMLPDRRKRPSAVFSNASPWRGTARSIQYEPFYQSASRTRSRLDHWRSSYGISTYSGRRGCRFPERTDQIPNNRFSFQPVDFGMQVITQCLGIANTPRGSPPATRSIPGRRCRADCGSCEPRSTPRRAIAGACYPCFCGLVDCGNATSSRVLTMSRTYIMLC
jgi:hypothetical protein